MLRFLLDEHISPAVAIGLRRKNRSLPVYCLSDWQNGQLLGQSDEAILKNALLEGLTLVTYDRKTIPPLLKLWAEEPRDHCGVIFIDQRTLPTSDFGGLVRALDAIHKEASTWDWTNRIYVVRHSSGV